MAMTGCRYPTGISSLSFNAAGDLLAIAASYAFEEGPKEYADDWHPPPQTTILFLVTSPAITAFAFRSLQSFSKSTHLQPVQIM
jgi:hypothetical protein